MSSATVFSAVRTFLTAQWTATPLAWPNETFNLPDAPAAWILVDLVGEAYDQVSIGSGSPTTERWIEEGALLLHIMVPTGSGSLLARQHAEALAGLLRGLQLPGLLRFQSMRIGDGAPGDEDGIYWRLTLRAEWIRG